MVNRAGDPRNQTSMLRRLSHVVGHIEHAACVHDHAGVVDDTRWKIPLNNVFWASTIRLIFQRKGQRRD